MGEEKEDAFAKTLVEESEKILNLLGQDSWDDAETKPLREELIRALVVKPG